MFTTIHCGTCMTSVGVTSSPIPPVVFCNEFCAGQKPVTDNELRDDLIMELHRRGKSLLQIQIELDLDLTRSRIHQIVQERDR